MNMIYVVAQVDDKNSLNFLGFRSIHTNPDEAKMDLDDANKMPKSATGWPHWKILIYDIKLKGVLE